MTQLTCPICHRLFDSQHAAALPFCSERCRLVDLHRWLSESYGLPVVRDDGEGQPEQDEAGEIDARRDDE